MCYRSKLLSEHSWNSDRRLLTTDETWTLVTDTQIKGWDPGGLCEGLSIWESLMSRLAYEACLLAFALASSSSLVSAKQAVRSVRCLLCTHRQGWGEASCGVKNAVSSSSGQPWVLRSPHAMQSTTTRLCCWADISWDERARPQIKTQCRA